MRPRLTPSPVWGIGAPYEAEVYGRPFRPSTGWAQGGPLIEQFRPQIAEHYRRGRRLWAAKILIEAPPNCIAVGIGYGETLLIAVCRALVMGKNAPARRHHDHSGFLEPEPGIEIDVPTEVLDVPAQWIRLG